MSDPLYALGVPSWSGVSSPGYAWLPPSIPLPNQLLGPGALGFSPAVPIQAPIQTPMLPTQAPFNVAGAYSGPVMAPELPANTTAPALLAAVAVRRGQPLGPTNDQEIEDFLYDALEWFPGASEVEVRSEGGRIALTGRVQHKKLKRDVGEIAWATPGVTDVHNNLAITVRRRTRAAGREQEQPNAARKPA